MIGESSLASLTEDTEARRALDEVYSGALLFALEGGLWNFAMRAIEANDTASVTPTYGFTYAFTKPDDWLRTAGVWSGASENEPLIAYSDEQGYWYANVTPIYIRYTSSDTSYGMDLAKWPMTFTRYVEAHLAAEIVERISQNASKHETLRKLERERLKDAKSKDALNEPARFPPAGSWTRSRGGRTSNRSFWNGSFS